MTRNPPGMPDVFEEPIGEELLTLEKRTNVYLRMKLSQRQIDEIEQMIADSPGRDIGKSARDNMITSLYSKKNNACRLVESHTCERVFAYELELFPGAIGYYTQVMCRNVEWIKDGRRSISAYCADFLVFTEDSIRIVECKYEDWLNREVVKPGTKWLRHDGAWGHAVYSNWAASKGLEFEVWSQRTPMGIYLENLEAAYVLLNEELEPADMRACRHALRIIKEKPCNIQTLKEMVPGFRERCVYWLLANQKAFGMMRCTTAIENEYYYLFSTQLQAFEADRAAYARMTSAFEQSQVTDPILTASRTDSMRAEKRLERIERIRLGKENKTERMMQLEVAIAKCVASGGTPFQACLTHFADSGNHLSRLTAQQRKEIEYVIVKFWNTGIEKTHRDLWYRLGKRCDLAEISTPSETTLMRHVWLEDPTIRAIRTGGLRKHHATRRRSEATKRSLAPLGYGFLLVIDSSQFDTRIAPNILTAFPAEKCKFYIGMDGATSYPMAHSLIFGSARTDGLAILVREYVHRHNFLPRIIQVDRGPENTSDWLKEFCSRNGIDLRYPPTGASQFNGLAENVIGRVNSQVAHKLAGSTEPDMAGRKTDGKFKSRKTARHTFLTILEEFKHYVYQCLPEIPNSEGGWPALLKEEALDMLGCFGKVCEFDFAFMIKTSIEIDYKGKGTERNGIRTGEGYFTSDALQVELRTKKADEVRRDCVDPSVLYVKVGMRWYKAFHARVQKNFIHTEEHKLFDLMYRSGIKKEIRTRKTEQGRIQHSRMELADQASPASKHLAPDRTVGQIASGDPMNQDFDLLEWDAIEDLQGSD